MEHPVIYIRFKQKKTEAFALSHSALPLLPLSSPLQHGNIKEMHVMLGMFNVKHSSWQAWLSATGSGRHEKFRPGILYAKDELGQSVISGKT